MKQSFFAILSVCALLLAGCDDSRVYNSSAQPAKQSSPEREDLVNLPDFSDLVDSVASQVVAIRVLVGGNSAGTGSGFFISADGYIVTNHHVVTPDSESEDSGPSIELPDWVPPAEEEDQVDREKANEVTYFVETSDGKEFPAQLIGSDSRTDLAVLKVSRQESGQESRQDFKPVIFGKVTEIKAGQSAVAIGAPYGYKKTVTSGIISGVDRVPNDGASSVGDYVDYLQSDVAINPGNSGGPLYNVKGELIGVNAMIYSKSGGFAGIAFSIPVNTAQKVSQQLIAKGKVSYGWLGVGMVDLNEYTTEDFFETFPQPQNSAIFAKVGITTVFPNTPAETGGMKDGDVLVNFDGKPVTSRRVLTHMVGNTLSGSAVSLDILRNGKLTQLNVTLSERPSEKVLGQQTERPEATPESSSEGSKYDLEKSKLADQAFKQLLGEHGLLRDAFNNFLDMITDARESYEGKGLSEEEKIKYRARAQWTSLLFTSMLDPTIFAQHEQIMTELAEMSEGSAESE